jgi:hypothetical protein
VAVVVVVAYGDALPVAGSGQARASGDVLEMAVLSLPIQAIPVAGPVLHRHRPGRHRIADVGPVHEKDVEAPVTVGVEDGDAGTHCFREVFLRRRGRLVAEVDADGFGHIHKPDRIGRRGGRRHGHRHESRSQEQKAKSRSFHGAAAPGPRDSRATRPRAWSMVSSASIVGMS